MSKLSWFFCFSTLLLQGCNYLRAFPMYSEFHIEHPDSIDLNPNASIKRSGSLYGSVRERVTEYLRISSGINPSIRAALKEMVILDGMNKEQVMLILGEPLEQTVAGDNQELWTYKGKSDFFWILNSAEQIKFENGLLIGHNQMDRLNSDRYWVDMRTRVETYFDEHPDVDPRIIKDLENFKVRKGMHAEQVMLLLGKPSTKKNLKGSTELWIYRWTDGRWRNLTFQDNVLIGIEARVLEIYK